MLKRKKDLNLVEVMLILICILLLCGIFYFITNYLVLNSFVYEVIVLLFIILTIVVAAIGMFQFVKMKYISAAKLELKTDMDSYKNQIGNKLIEANSRIGHFEVDYSKKLKKVTKDYLIKAKEIEDMKKELAEKLKEVNRKAAELEVETCLVKVDKMDFEHKLSSYKRIIQLNEIYPGICNEQIMEEVLDKTKVVTH